MRTHLPIRALLVSALLAGGGPAAFAGGILREVYTDLPGNTLGDLTNSVKFPDRPDSTNILQEFEAPIDVGQNYGQRVRGFLLPPTGGNYVFWIASDDYSALYLSSDQSPAKAVQIASVPGWTASRQWDKYAGQQSASIRLEANRAYYVEALMKQGYGGDNLAVRWQLPDGTIEEPILEARLLPWGMAFGPPQIAEQPVDVTVTEGQAAELKIKAGNLDPVTYQWQRAGIDIAGADGATYVIPATTLADNRARFRCRLTNPLGSVLSAEAVLTVLPDRQPPSLSTVQNYGPQLVNVRFSEPVELTSASNPANYGIDQGVRIVSAVLNPDSRTVVLSTSGLTFGNLYTLTVNNVRDRAASPNTIAPNSRAAFLASEFTPMDIGDAGQPGSATPTPGGVDVLGGGTGLGPNADQFQFAYQERSGDFDLQVRVQSLELVDVWTLAGLMARASLQTNSPYAAILATPSISGIGFMARVGTNASILKGTFPVNYPWTWLRLKRAGDLFTGLASLDGRKWTLVGSITNNLPRTLFFGMAVSSRSAGQPARAQFRDFANAAGVITSDGFAAVEPLGPSSRRTGLVISEIMYHPAPREDARELEFIELFNTQPFPEDVGGFRLAGAIDFKFPPNAVIPGGGFLVVARVPADVQAVYGLPRVLGGYTNNLPNDAGTLRLHDSVGGVLLEVNYANHAPWPAAAGGAGHSLVLARPSFGEGSPAAWAASQRVGGSPGALDAVQPEPLSAVMINEFLAHTDNPQLNFIELYNHSNDAVDLSGAVLTDNPRTNKFTLPAGTSIPARGFLVFAADALGFALDSTGEGIYFFNRERTRVIDAVRFGAQALGISSGRFPDGAPSWHELQAPTPGAANSDLLIRDIVINEIMYQPLSEQVDDQYVELLNRGAQAVSLARWRFTAGIDFTFPATAVIPPNGFVVVAKNAARLMTNYPNLSSLNTFGDFQGKLSGAGERLVLARPGDPLVPDRNFVEVDEVTYGTAGRWGKWSHGGGSSLELADAHADHRLAPNWGESDEAAKAPWTIIEATDSLDLGDDTFGVKSLQVMLMGEGECLVDEVEVIDPNGVNLVANSSFAEGLTGWRALGTHTRSRWERSEGYRSQGSLHLVASGRGATDANNVQTDLLGSLTPGSYATLRARVRWLRGNPDILLRLRGNYMEAAGRMVVPPNLGTPGAPNSATVNNAGPAIFAVQHSPVLPALNQPALVTARVHDPDGIAAVRLRYRVDPSPDVFTLNMVDDGTGGDEVAGDGIYSALLPGQPTTNLLAFHIQAIDNAPTKVASTFPTDAPARECLVRWGESVPPGNLATYRVWITQATLDEWANRAPSSNDPLDATFAYGNYRAVYNMETYYSGSPFHWTGYDSPIGRNCAYVLVFPADDAFLGTSDYVLNMPSNMGSDSAAQREQTFFWMVKQLGRPYNHRRFVYVFLNGIKRGTVYEDAQQPNADVIKQWYPNDTNGDLYKIEDWFEYDDSSLGFVNTDATLDNFTGASGEKKRARYRWNWRKRAVHGSAHDYSNIFALVDALNTPDADYYTTQVEALVDVEQWMQTMALRHIVGDWDAYGYRRGKNMYAYKPTAGKWQLLDWDISFDFGLGDGPTANLFDAAHFDGTIDKVTERMYNNPPFRRAYLRAVQEAVDHALVAEKVGPVMDAKYTALRANAVPVTAPASIKTWIETRRTNLLQVLATNAAPFAVTTHNGADFSVSTRNLVTLEGTAPVALRWLQVNGRTIPVTWTSVTNWALRVALTNGDNTFVLQGLDVQGIPAPAASARVRVTFSGRDESPQDHLRISEIMYHPSAPDAGYVEIHNTSSASTFDLSNYRLRGVDFQFAEGTLIEPGAYLVVVNNRAAFVAAYGYRLQIAGEFKGRLRNDGDTLSLVRPGPTPGAEMVLNQVAYTDQWPWPAAADGTGASLQLVDAAADNRRVTDWTAVAGGGDGSGGWKFASVTGPLTSQSLYIYLVSSGDVYLDDVMLVPGTVPEAGASVVVNGDFEGGLAGSWTISPDDPDTKTTTRFKHRGQNSLHLVSTGGGNILLPSIGQTTSLIARGAPYTLSFWYLPSTNGGGLTVGLLGSSVQQTVSIVPGGVGPAPATPGAPNSVQATLPRLPALALNEVQPNNLGGRADGMGHKEPWLELFNSGATAVALTNCYLADSPANPLQWAFPAGTVVPPGGFLLVWADGKPEESSATEPHTTFRLNPTNGTVALTLRLNSQPYVLDYLHYDQVPADRSYGSFPDGDPIARQVFQYPTPAAANTNATPPLTILINEWMASNRATIADPADGQFEDWFELYNPNDSAVDLSGYTLTDDLTRPRQWALPVGTTISAHGFLLIWADNDPNQTGPGTGLHTNFRLGQGGEFIGMFGPDGVLIDAVTFGPQNVDVSEGRFPDGAPAPFAAMTTPTPGQPNVGTSAGPRITQAVLGETGLRLAWSAQTGSKYQVQFRADLTQALWLPLGDPLTASGPSLSIVDPSVATTSQRYYRIVLLP